MTRVLMCITVYNGRAFVPHALASAARIDGPGLDIDVLVLDDCSPEPGWSDELAALCNDLGLRYYRSPRNLGIPRNVNLGLLVALHEDYDAVVVCNSDVLFPRTLVTRLLEAAGQPGVGSVTAWSNNVSVYSLPNRDPAAHLDDQDVVDWVAESLAGNFAGSVMDIPTAISFCLLVPIAVLRDVGLMDPVFGRGYCEEIDWTLRSQRLGYRSTLATSTFVYHAGSGSTRDAGVLPHGATTVAENERIIDLRYPQFRSQVGAFMGSGILQQAHRDALDRIVRDAGGQFGYTVEVGWLPRVSSDDAFVRCIVAPDGLARVRFLFRGFETETDFADVPALAGDDRVDRQVLAWLADMFGRAPDQVNLHDRGVLAGRLRDAAESSAAAGTSATVVHDLHAYPTRV